MAWPKGAWYEGGAAHEWISVRFTPKDEGTALMELPPKFLEDFVVQLEPFCSIQGGVSPQEAEQ